MVVATSRILTLEHKIPRLLVNNPEVVRATPISPNQVQLSALQPGVTQLNVWDENQGLYTVDVVVTPDGRQLQMLIKSEFPDAAVRVRPLANSVYLSGYVPSPAMVNSIVRIAEDYYPKVVNNMTIGGVQQILLKTKVMEVSRTKLRRAGFDWAYLNDEVAVIQTVSGLLQGGGTARCGVRGDWCRHGAVRHRQRQTARSPASSTPLRQNDLIKVLAEPQLTTVSGRPASFNSGGEFPIIVPQSLGTVSIEYRQYGTRVDFVPIVLGNGNLRLEVRPQVSEIDRVAQRGDQQHQRPGSAHAVGGHGGGDEGGPDVGLGRLAPDTRGSPESRAPLAGRHAVVWRAVPSRERGSQRGRVVDSGHARVRGSVRSGRTAAVRPRRVDDQSERCRAVLPRLPGSAEVLRRRQLPELPERWRAERDAPRRKRCSRTRPLPPLPSDVDASAKRPSPAGQPAATKIRPGHGNRSAATVAGDATTKPARNRR